MNNKKAKELEIPIVFHNYKLLEDREWALRGSYIYFVQGPNKVGKTSFLTALEGLMTAKDLTDKKVSVKEGVDTGYYEATLPAADGSMITIRNEFTDEKNKFIAINEDGEKISSVTEIRKLFNYTPINVNEFFQMSRTTDGRRKQRDIVLKLLPEDLRDKFEDLDLQEQHYYAQRTAINRDLVALFLVVPVLDNGHPIPDIDRVRRHVILGNQLVVIEDILKLLDAAFKKSLGIARSFQFGIIDKIIILAIFKSGMQPISHLFTTDGSKLRILSL